MSNKSAVSTLQEYCAQNKIDEPKYEYIDAEDGGFICKVEVLNMEALGNGRSKRDAKHLSASNIMKKIRARGFDVQTSMAGALGDCRLQDELTNSNRDMLRELRDFCVQHEMPLPTIEIVQQCGTPNAPVFVARCSVATIKRYATSDKKKDARQKAAIEMFRVICTDTDEVREHHLQVVSTNPKAVNVDTTLDDIESERRQKFKTYRELTDDGSVEVYGIRMSERHNYFKKFYPQLKDAAMDILRSDIHETPKSKAYDVLHALKLEPRITEMVTDSSQPLLFIELNCDYDCCFAGFEDKIYNDILNYFSEMLV